MKKALIIIDVQNCFINNRTRGIPQKIADHIRDHSYDEILFTQFINKKNSNFYTLIDWKYCNDSPDIDISADLLEFVTPKTIFVKHTYSAFKAKGLKAYLKRKKITKLFLCGIDADSCILASAYEGFDLGYDIMVLTQLIACGTKNALYDFTVEVLNRNIQKPQ